MSHMAASRHPTSSTPLPFRRLHGCGNDYVYLNGWVMGKPDLTALQIQALADRHTGIGGDGVIWIGPSEDNNAAEMRMWNADGSESEMCGNGLRCAVKVAFDDGRLGPGQHAITTGAGTLQATIDGDPGAAEHHVVLDMGMPHFDPHEIPNLLAAGGETQHIEIDGEIVDVVPVGMGNPHAVLFVEDTKSAPVHSLGPQIEHHASFPNRTNVEFIQCNADGSLTQRTWERGSGETMACGTGACAAAIAAIRTGRVPAGEVLIHLLGGDLLINWREGQHCTLSGPATAICEGTVDLGQLSGPIATTT